MVWRYLTPTSSVEIYSHGRCVKRQSFLDVTRPRAWSLIKEAQEPVCPFLQQWEVIQRASSMGNSPYQILNPEALILDFQPLELWAMVYKLPRAKYHATAGERMNIGTPLCSLYSPVYATYLSVVPVVKVFRVLCSWPKNPLVSKQALTRTEDAGTF
jgi:hypothetical protein